MNNNPYSRKRHYWKNNKNPSLSKPKSFTEIASVDNEQVKGYLGFKLYFPDEDLKKIDDILEHTEYCQKFLNNNKEHFNLNTIQKNKCFSLDYDILRKNDKLIEQWGGFLINLTENTFYCLNCFGLAMHQIIFKYIFELNDNNIDKLTFKLCKIRAQIINYHPILQMKDLGVNIYEKLVTVKGTVIKSSLVKVQCEYMTFKCNSCNGLQLRKLHENVYTIPTKCPTVGCQTKTNFEALPSSPHTRTITCQNLKIQELIEDQYENGRTPRTLECDLTEDLVNACVPGDDVTICGVVNVRKEQQKFKTNLPAAFSLYIQAISVVNDKNRTQGAYGASERISFNLDDYYAIQKIHAESELFRYLVQSLCPRIYGHDIVKAGLLLALFGGTVTDSTRAESHVLIIGDPGLGKSQMLQACTNTAPRGVYVCGQTSTSSGLTVTMARDAGGEFTLEAGALMLADQGCCCIDEFDKVPNQHACLLEAMEQQSISIAKAGITCTLPTRTTILAAANPADGHYNQAKTIAENLKISSPMLSRFDLIFILLDQANEDLDAMLSKHILGMHSRSGNISINSSHNVSFASASEGSLRLRLQIRPDEKIDYLPHTLFRKYIAYAQKYVNPQLSEGAKLMIKNFYLDLRKKFQTGECTPVTTRQLQSLIRLTQARAKSELREEATTQDAADVIEIMKKSLSDIFTDETGLLNTTRTQGGTGMSSRNKALKLINKLQEISKAESRSLFTYKEIQTIGEQMGLVKEKVQSLIETLNLQGYLLCKGSSKYQLQSV